MAEAVKPVNVRPKYYSYAIGIVRVFNSQISINMTHETVVKNKKYALKLTYNLVVQNEIIDRTQ